MPRTQVAKLSKSELIREYRQDHPTAKPLEIVAGLREKGVRVTPKKVSNVLYASKQRKLFPFSPLKPRKYRRRQAGRVMYRELLIAKRHADRMGGIQRARAALETLAKILS